MWLRTIDKLTRLSTHEAFLKKIQNSLINSRSKQDDCLIICNGSDISVSKYGFYKQWFFFDGACILIET